MKPSIKNIPPPKLSLAVQYVSTAQNLPTRAQLRRWIKTALQCDVRITLRIVDEAEGRELNKSYRGKDYATNVLTFTYDDAEPPTGEPLYGDVIICARWWQKKAAGQHKTCCPTMRTSPFTQPCICKAMSMRMTPRQKRWKHWKPS